MNNILPDLQALAVPLERVAPLPENPRKGDVDKVAGSLATFGQHKPIVARRTGTDGDGHDTGIVLAGNHTLAAARKLGWDSIAVVWTDDDELVAKARALADNHVAELGGYDEALLTAMIKEVSADPALLAATAYSDDDLARMLSSNDADSDEDDEEFDDSPIAEPLSKTGDVWLLGSHRIMCGDCRLASDVDQLLGDVRINLAFTSPPYASQRKYDPSSGFKPIPQNEYVSWFNNVQANVKAHLADDGSWFVNIKPASEELDTELYVLDLVLAHAREWGWHFVEEYCWERTGIPKRVARRFKNQFEPIYQFVLNEFKFHPDAVRHASQNVPTNGTSLYGPSEGWQGKKSNRQRKGSSKTMSETQGTNAQPGEFVVDGMAYPGNRLPTFTSTHTATGHTAAFPVGLPKFFIEAYTDKDDIVFDPFMGSGSTLLAAHQTNRVAFGSEISPEYVDMICRRFQKVTGIKPVLEATGEPHDFGE